MEFLITDFFLFLVVCKVVLYSRLLVIVWEGIERVSFLIFFFEETTCVSFPLELVTSEATHSPSQSRFQEYFYFIVFVFHSGSKSFCNFNFQPWRKAQREVMIFILATCWVCAVHQLCSGVFKIKFKNSTVTELITAGVRYLLYVVLD